MVKVTIQLASLIIAVKHNLCYWMSNKPLISSDFSKLQYISKFTDICIFVCIFVHICVYSFHMCYTRFGAYPNHTHIKIIVKKKKQAVGGGGEETEQIGTNITAHILMLDCWLEVGLHLEDPTTGQLDQGFPWFSLVPEQMLSWYPYSALLCMLRVQPC
jgi:hypothetical protein